MANVPPMPCLTLGPLTVQGFRQLDDEDVWLGTVHILGTPMHFQAIRVERETEPGIWKGTRDPYDRLEDVYQVNDAPPIVTQIPGLEGDFVVLIFPHGD